MKIFDHPVHPLLIHFPTALLPMDLALSVFSFLKNDASFSLAGFYCLVAGVIMGFAAIGTGLIELIAIPKTDRQALAMGLYHGFINTVIILIFGIIAWKAWQGYPLLEVQTITGIIFKGILILLLFIGNYMGGRLIYKYGIGLNTKHKVNGNTTS